MKTTLDHISQLIEQILAEHKDLFVVDFELKGSPGNQKLVLQLDGDNGVSIDQCALISRRLGYLIEEGELIDGKYNLQVTSPGVDAPLKYPRQFKRNVGRSLRVDIRSGERIEGKLKSADDMKLELAVKSDSIEIEFDQIDKATVLVSFK
ncbi:MAG: ribosome maturation factor RimP [Cyclobacteriaceae bacterium]